VVYFAGDKLLERTLGDSLAIGDALPERPVEFIPLCQTSGVSGEFCVAFDRDARCVQFFL